MATFITIVIVTVIIFYVQSQNAHRRARNYVLNTAEQILSIPLGTTRDRLKKLFVADAQKERGQDLIIERESSSFYVSISFSMDSSDHLTRSITFIQTNHQAAMILFSDLKQYLAIRYGSNNMFSFSSNSPSVSFFAGDIHVSIDIENVPTVDIRTGESSSNKSASICLGIARRKV